MNTELEPLTEEAEILAELKRVDMALKKGARSFKRLLGWQGGHHECTVEWHEEPGMWGLVLPYATESKSRHWCCFGLEYPGPQRLLNIVCEINPPLRGVNRRCAGILAKDQNGHVYYCHSGKVGGGRPGVGKAAFIRFYRGRWVEVVWPDRQRQQVILVACIGEPGLITRLHDFTVQVARFKEASKAGTLP